MLASPQPQNNPLRLPDNYYTTVVSNVRLRGLSGRLIMSTLDSRAFDSYKLKRREGSG